MDHHVLGLAEFTLFSNSVYLTLTCPLFQVVKDGVQFTIDTSRAGAGVLTAACTGPDGSLVPVECKKSGGDQLVTIKPNKVGGNSSFCALSSFQNM